MTHFKLKSMSDMKENEIPAPKGFWVRLLCRHRWVFTNTYTTNNYLTPAWFIFGGDDLRREIIFEHRCEKCGEYKETSV